MSDTKLIEKECKACGKFFQTKTNKRLYCDDCRKNGKGKQIYNQIRDNQFRNARQYPEKKKVEIITYKCEYCGKEHVTPINSSYYDISIPPDSVLNWDNKRHQYCCKQHKNIDLRNHLKCDICGKSLKDNDFDSDPDDFNYTFNVCSEECKEKYYAYKRAKRVYNRTCKFCGKEFPSHTKKDNYCSEECKRKEQEQKEFNESHVKIRNRCPICNKRFESLIPREQFMRGMYKQQVFCSDECRDLYNKTMLRRNKDE